MSYPQRGDYKPLDLENDGDTMLVASYLMDYVDESKGTMNIDALTMTIQQLLNDLVASLDRSPVADEIEARLDKLTGITP